LPRAAGGGRGRSRCEDRTTECTARKSTDGRARNPSRSASHQCLPKEQQHALLAHGSFARAVGGGQSEPEAQLRPHNKARRPVLELALRQPSWMSPKIRAPAPASDVHGRECRARPSGREMPSGRACADCAAVGGRATFRPQGRLPADGRAAVGAHADGSASAARRQRFGQGREATKAKREHHEPSNRCKSASIALPTLQYWCVKSVTFMENGPEGEMRAALSARPCRLAN
jgi:hypothetical protein